MSDFRKLGPAVVDADSVRIVQPAGISGAKVRITFKTGAEEVIFLGVNLNSEVTDDDLIRGAINEFYRPYNPPGAVTYEAAPFNEPFKPKAEK
jgi:hypothetical protein